MVGPSDSFGSHVAPLVQVGATANGSAPPVPGAPPHAAPDAAYSSSHNGWAFDARLRRGPFEARAVAAQFFLPKAGALLSAYRTDGTLYYPNPTANGAIPNRTQGGYVELACDVLRFLIPSTSQQLLPSVRAEHYNTQAAVPSPYTPRGDLKVNELTIALNYLPIRQVVAKADVQLRDRRYGLDELQIDFGLGWMF